MKKPDSVENYLDSSEELKKKGIYYITGEIEEDSLLDIQQDILLKHLDPSWYADIQLIINSVGGDIDPTWALVDLLAYVRMNVRTIGMGHCGSCGATLLACGDERVGCKNLSVMIHGASTVLAGNKQQIVSTMKYMEQEHERDIQFWIEHSKYTTRKQIEKFFLDGQDKWMTSDTALKHGIIDEVQF